MLVCPDISSGRFVFTLRGFPNVVNTKRHSRVLDGCPSLYECTIKRILKNWFGVNRTQSRLLLFGPMSAKHAILLPGLQPLVGFAILLSIIYAHYLPLIPRLFPEVSFADSLSCLLGMALAIKRIILPGESFSHLFPDMLASRMKTKMLGGTNNGKVFGPIVGLISVYMVNMATVKPFATNLRERKRNYLMKSLVMFANAYRKIRGTFARRGHFRLRINHRFSRIFSVIILEPTLVRNFKLPIISWHFSPNLFFVHINHFFSQYTKYLLNMQQTYRLIDNYSQQRGEIKTMKV